MASPEQSPSLEEKNKRRLVFDEKRNKWRLSREGIPGTGNHRGHLHSLKQADNISEGLKRYWQERREQQQ